jgi:lipopolysaccharide transport system permease protein
VSGRGAEPVREEAGEPAHRNVIEWSDSLLGHARELLRHRELLYNVAEREIKVRYKPTALGALWAVVQPLSLMLVFTVFFSLYLRMPSDGIPYPLFSYAALLPWTFFSTAVSFATPSLIANSHIITKIYFPREIVPLASVLAALVDFTIAATIFVGMLIFYRIAPTWMMFYVLPLLVIQIVFTMAVGLGLSALTVLYRDTRFMVPLLLQLWMFVTPILYPLSIVPESIRGVYLTLNPMATIVDGYRRSILQGQAPDLILLLNATAISFALLWLAYKYFKHQERQFADII